MVCIFWNIHYKYEGFENGYELNMWHSSFWSEQLSKQVKPFVWGLRGWNLLEIFEWLSAKEKLVLWQGVWWTHCGSAGRDQEFPIPPKEIPTRSVRGNGFTVVKDWVNSFVSPVEKHLEISRVADEDWDNWLGFFVLMRTPPALPSH